MPTDDASQHRTPITPHMAFVLVSESTALTRRDLYLMALAMKADQVTFAAAWGRIAATFHAAGTLQDAAPGSIVLRFVDAPSVPDALAWHTEDADGRIVTEVSVQAILGDGGGILDGGTSGESVASAAHHEVIETQVDPSVNLWADRFDGTQVALEACDPVQGILRPVMVKEPTSISGLAEPRDVVVQLSNYVFPAWFDPQAPTGARLDAMRAATAPLALTKGGYQVLRTVGKELPVRWGMLRARNRDLSHSDQERVVEFDDAVPESKRARILHRVDARLSGRGRPAPFRPSAA